MITSNISHQCYNFENTWFVLNHKYMPIVNLLLVNIIYSLLLDSERISFM